MNKLIAGAAAAALALTVAGCSRPAPTETPASGGTVTTTSQAPTNASNSPTTPVAPPSPSGTASATTSAAPVDQSTPDAVMTGWLTALLAGDSSNVCGLMAANGTAIEDLPSAKEQCAQAVTPMLDQLKSVKDMFKGLKVEGATVQGDTATFDKAKTSPDMAATIIKNLKAVKLKGKWYVTQG